MLLTKRIDVLERRACQDEGGTHSDPSDLAITALVGAVYDLLPCDPPYLGGPNRQTIMHSPEWQSTDDKLKQLLLRGRAGTLTDDDRRVLNGLPAPALAVFDMSPLDWIAMSVSVLESF